jgi:hypothetical protein
MAGVKLSKDAAKRTKATVIGWERDFASLEGEHRMVKGAPYVGFWAKITANAFGSKKYSWEKLEATASDTFISNTEWGTGDRTKTEGYAVEVNGSQYVLKDSIVWLTPAFGQDYFNFEYRPSKRIAKTEGTAIAGMTGNTFGFSTVSVYKNAGGTRVDTNQDVKVFNTWEAEVKANTFIQIAYSVDDACWYIDVEECDA